MILEIGEIFPCDGVLCHSSGDLLIDESAMTGESDLIQKIVP